MIVYHGTTQGVARRIGSELAAGVYVTEYADAARGYALAATVAEHHGPIGELRGQQRVGVVFSALAGREDLHQDPHPAGKVNRQYLLTRALPVLESHSVDLSMPLARLDIGELEEWRARFRVDRFARGVVR